MKANFIWMTLIIASTLNTYDPDHSETSLNLIGTNDFRESNDGNFKRRNSAENYEQLQYNWVAKSM